MNDSELLRLLRSDPELGLSKTVDIYSAYVLKIAHTKLNGLCSEEDIEELVSDVFMAFYMSGKKNDFNIRSVTAYISVIAERRCINMFRSKLRQPDTIPIDELEYELAEQVSNTDGDTLSQAVASLGEPDTEIFLRKYYFGQKSEDIARELDMKTNTVNKRISRGLKKLRKILEEDA